MSNSSDEMLKCSVRLWSLSQALNVWRLRCTCFFSYQHDLQFLLSAELIKLRLFNWLNTSTGEFQEHTQWKMPFVEPMWFILMSLSQERYSSREGLSISWSGLDYLELFCELLRLSWLKKYIMILKFCPIWWLFLHALADNCWIANNKIVHYFAEMQLNKPPKKKINCLKCNFRNHIITMYDMKNRYLL